MRPIASTSLRASSLTPSGWLSRLVAGAWLAADRVSDRPGVRLAAGAVFVAVLAALVTWAASMVVLL
jgi:hypothetical protein